jgi:hypothetical protein
MKYEAQGCRGEAPGRFLQTRLGLHASPRAAKLERMGEYRRERESPAIVPGRVSIPFRHNRLSPQFNHGVPLLDSTPEQLVFVDARFVET